MLTEKKRLSNAAWRARHPDRVKAYAAKWRSEHPKRKRGNRPIPKEKKVRAIRIYTPEELEEKRNRERIQKRECLRQWKQRNRDKVSVYNRRQYLKTAGPPQPRVPASAETIRLRKVAASAQKVLYRKANKEKTAATKRAYRESHPTECREACHRRRARKYGTATGDTKLIRQWDRSWRSRRTATCYWCRNKTPTATCHADHIVALFNGGAHCVENLCVSCAACNQKKHAKVFSEWNQTLAQPVLDL